MNQWTGTNGGTSPCITESLGRLCVRPISGQTKGHVDQPQERSRR